MASTLTRILLHITFSTKKRGAMIPEAIEADLYAYIGGICRRMESSLLAMGGTADHVHMLVSLGKTVALSDLMLEVKRDSSKWIKGRDAALREFAWQDGYFGVSVGEAGVDALRAYIGSQKEHHRTIDFKDEVRAFLKRNGVEWDERYIWE
ncbi:MAG: IS200/IS605 family transposase [Phycisphaerales bacterium]